MATNMDSTLQRLATASQQTPPPPTPSPFPITTKQASRLVHDIPTDVMVLYFSDKIMITITQEGRLAQWFNVPLNEAHPSYLEAKSSTDEDGLLPLIHLTPKCLLGAGTSERQLQGQLYAVQIASAIAMRNIREERAVVLGLGLKSDKEDREGFIEVISLVGECLRACELVK